MTPENMTPLTPDQARLVEEHAEWARRGAFKKQWRAKGRLDVDDLASAAYMGLICAARRFDPARGWKFKTFAMPWCESFMKRAYDQHRRANGAVFDARVEGGMRAVITRVAWPAHPDGTPQDIAMVPPTQHDAVALQSMRTWLHQHATEPKDKALVAAILKGGSLREIGRVLNLTTRGVQMRTASLVVKLRRKASRLRKAA